MTAARYILRSLLHHRFAYLGVLAGAVLGATVLLGALFAGDSVTASLRRISESRTGRATHIVAAGDRFFRQALADDLARAAGVRSAPVLYARGTATHASSRAAVNRVQLIGVTDAFWQLAPRPTAVALDAAKSAIAINDTLARRLSVKIGDALIVRLQKPGVLAGNAPIAGSESTLQSIRGTVAAIVDDASFGRFSLETTQVAQPSVFLPVALLQQALERSARANLLLVDAGASNPDLRTTLARTAQLADYGLTLKWLESAAVFELSADRIFIDPEIAEAITASVPSAQPVLTYLVNEIRARDRATPYSLATATTREAAPFLPADVQPQDIVLNDWLAEDLQAKIGDDVRLTYFQTGAGGGLVEQSSTFRVRAIVPLQGLAADRAWMPDFPGISDAPSPSDWDPGLPLNLERIRDKDERYWDEFRGAPKAFLPIAAGRAIWSNRWGNATALRIPFERSRDAELTATLLRALRPEMNQLLVRDFRASAVDAAKSPVDFGGLFIGMSFFLIVAALGLVAMLFQFCLLQRNREDALLGAVGVPAAKLLRWRLAEAVALLGAGCAIGVPLAMLYTRGILRFLESIWAGETGGSMFVVATKPQSIATGCGIFLLLSLLAVWLAIRKQTRRALSIRLAAQAEEISPVAKIRRSSWIVAWLGGVVAIVAVALSNRELPAQGAFYLAGFAVLAAGLAVCRAWLASTPRASRDTPLRPEHLGKLNVRARRSRSLTVVGLIATAVFMVLSVASFRKHIGTEWLEPRSGTGGFAFWVETTAALNPARDGRSSGFEAFESSAKAIGDVVPFRAGVGDNANCFNLNTTAQPQLLGGSAAKLAARDAFHVHVPSHSGNDSHWNALRARGGGSPIPALVDETTLLWALKRKIGDVLSYTDENGRAFDVQIVGTLRGSIFQGYLVIDETYFLEKFPSNPGYSIFLLDARSTTDISTLRNQLETATRDAGGRVEITRDLLAAFHAIENTYIAIFNVLGSLGVILGSLGLAIVVARNLRERRGEFAMMSAIGLPQSVLERMVFTEYGRLVLWGIVIGGIASGIAVWPNLTSLPPAPTITLVAALLVGIIALNLACGWTIFRRSLREMDPREALAGA